MARLSNSLDRFPRLLLFLPGVGLVALLGYTMRLPAAPQTSPSAAATPLSTPAARLEWQGVASCAATACHGGNGPAGSKGSEYTTWVLEDRHTQAYLVLFNERSQRIEKNLHAAERGKENRAEKDRLCLRCHAMNADNGPQREAFVRDFGIGCESCHGIAQQWLGVHYGQDWQSTDKAALGFRPLQKLEARARLCATCHVGDADKEVNHDLIAAGHPRLNFDFGAYQALMPKHWREVEENAQPDFEARAWAIGQVVSAQAALGLLEHRVRTASSPWPEFAEYDCFACHHDLHEPSSRQKAEHYAKRTPGSLPWGSWYFALLPQAVGGPQGEGSEALGKLIEGLKKELQKPLPSRERTAQQVQPLSDALARLSRAVDGRHYATPAMKQWFGALRAQQPSGAAATWDGQAQAYLAQAALYNALNNADPQRRDAGLRNVLKAEASRLAFPKGYDSPHQPESSPGGTKQESAPR